VTEGTQKKKRKKKRKEEGGKRGSRAASLRPLLLRRVRPTEEEGREGKRLGRGGSSFVCQHLTKAFLYLLHPYPSAPSQQLRKEKKKEKGEREEGGKMPRASTMPAFSLSTLLLYDPSVHRYRKKKKKKTERNRPPRQSPKQTLTPSNIFSLKQGREKKKKSPRVSEIASSIFSPSILRRVTRKKKKRKKKVGTEAETPCWLRVHRSPLHHRSFQLTTATEGEKQKKEEGKGKMRRTSPGPFKSPLSPQLSVRNRRKKKKKKEKRGEGGENHHACGVRTPSDLSAFHHRSRAYRRDRKKKED